MKKSYLTKEVIKDISDDIYDTLMQLGPIYDANIKRIKEGGFGNEFNRSDLMKLATLYPKLRCFDALTSLCAGLTGKQTATSCLTVEKILEDNNVTLPYP